MSIYALHTGAELAQKINHRTPSKALQIGYIGTQSPANGTEAGNIRPTWLIDQDTIDWVGTQVILSFLEQPRTKRLMVKAGNIMIAPMPIHHPRFWVMKRIPAGHQ